MTDLRAPFPWFGGKSRVAHIVWDGFGPVGNYVEPFAGSLAVLLGRPSKPQTETINDLDGYVANFWRALKHDPEKVAYHADNPVNENDLHARHVWLLKERENLRALLEGDPDYYDAKIAGVWVWGQCCWIGSGWCSGRGPWWPNENGRLVDNRARPHLGNEGTGVNRKLPHLGNEGRGVKRQLPHLGNEGQGVKRQLPLLTYLCGLSERLVNVRVCSGDWSRVCGPSVTFKHGLTGVFLDPPYADTAERNEELYTEDCLSVAHDVRTWCLENGANPLLRIALCGYDTEHGELEGAGWSVHSWKAKAGYQSEKSGNSKRERIWFSPACIPARSQGSLFIQEAS